MYDKAFMWYKNGKQSIVDAMRESLWIRKVLLIMFILNILINPLLSLTLVDLITHIWSMNKGTFNLLTKLFGSYKYWQCYEPMTITWMAHYKWLDITTSQFQNPILKWPGKEVRLLYLSQISIENCEKNISCFHQGSNLRPLYYQTSTLPLSYLICSQLSSDFYQIYN